MRHEFARNGGDSHSVKLFENFTPSIRDFLAEQGRIQPSEIPVLAFFKDQEIWLLATSHRIVWSTPTSQEQLKYAQITAMGWSSGPAGAATRKHPDEVDFWIDTESGLERTKTASPWLFVMDTSSERHEVLLEPGTALLAVWNCVGLMLRLEEIHPRPETVID